jgi:acylphosphatase
VKEIYCIVHGNVQGVFFRQFVKGKAEGLGISGYAKNLPDGTVEIVAQGKEDNLKLFLAAATVGPENAEVESANVSWGAVEQEMWGFSME